MLLTHKCLSLLLCWWCFRSGHVWSAACMPSWFSSLDEKSSDVQPVTISARAFLLSEFLFMHHFPVIFKRENKQDRVEWWFVDQWSIPLLIACFMTLVLLLFLPGIECFGYSVLNSATFEVLAAFPLCLFTMRTTSHVIDSRIFLGKVEAWENNHQVGLSRIILDCFNFKDSYLSYLFFYF